MRKKPYYGFSLISACKHLALPLSVCLLLAVLPLLSAIHTFIKTAFVCIGIIGSVLILLQLFGANKSVLTIAERLADRAEVRESDRVLDLGTGPGTVAITFAKRAKNGKVYGIDLWGDGSYSTKERAEVNARLEGVENRCGFAVADCTKKLDFEDEYFDIIAGSQILHELQFHGLQEDYGKVFKEINRLLNPNGKIIFVEPNKLKRWNINKAKDFFDNLGYKTEIIPIKYFLRWSTFIGQKQF
jgi:ubiquinone/menaquinone biosynthesis C-methylase UbiE